MTTISVPSIAKSEAAEIDRVVLAHLALVKSIARRLHANLPVCADLEDLIQAGILGLLGAATKYRADKNVPFAIYAKHRIKGAMIDSLRRLDWASRAIRGRQREVAEVIRILSIRLQRNPIDEEIAAALGLELQQWHQINQEIHGSGLVSASSLPIICDDLPPPEFPCKVDSHPDNIWADKELRSAMDVAIKCLPQRYQQLVMMYYFDQMTMKAIGGILGVNESRVSQMHTLALRKLHVALESNGIQSNHLL